MQSVHGCTRTEHFNIELIQTSKARVSLRCRLLTQHSSGSYAYCTWTKQGLDCRQNIFLGHWVITPDELPACLMIGCDGANGLCYCKSTRLHHVPCCIASFPSVCNRCCSEWRYRMGISMSSMSCPSALPFFVLLVTVLSLILLYVPSLEVPFPQDCHVLIRSG